MDKKQPLERQFKDGDLILISQVFKFKTKWKDNKTDLPYYTNIAWGNLLNILLDEYNIDDIDNKNYYLKVGGQFILPDTNIPFEGVTEEVEVVEILGKN